MEEGWAILTGRPAGERDEDGAFAEGSVNRAVADRLARWAELWRGFGQSTGPEEEDDDSP